METKNNYDLIVIGGGPAGYSAAIRGAQLGAKVLLIDKEGLGGTCMNRGCIPTKFLWTAQHLERRMKRASDYGLTVEIKEKSLSAVQQKKNRTVELMGKSLRRLIEGYKVVIEDGAARFTGPKTVTVTAKDGVEKVFIAPKFVIAAGSRPKSIPGIELDHAKFIDSTDALCLTEAPKSLLVIGGGAIGIEMALIYAGHGSEVMLVEKEPQLLPGEDAELAEEVKKILQRNGVKVQAGFSGFAELLPSYEKVLVATGRQVNTDNMGLELAGVEHGRRGITANEFLETTAEGIFAAGDIAGRSLLAYTAQAEGVVAAENALGSRNRPEYATIPRVVFSAPVAAAVGAKEHELQPEAITIGRCPISAIGRAAIEGERTGWVKVIADKASGTLLGGQVVSPSADELITILAFAVKYKLTIHQLSRELFFHPSLTEALFNACEDAQKKCVELPRKP